MRKKTNRPDFSDNCFNPDHSHNHIVSRNKSKRFYLPWYNDDADYNTNAPSYYDFLARFNQLIRKIQEVINKLLDRDIQVLDTPTVDLIKVGDWQNWDNIITLSAKVLLSKDGKNAIIYGDDGALYVYDYKDELKSLGDAITKLGNRDIKTVLSSSIQMTKSLSWLDGEDVITLKSDVRLSPPRDGIANAIMSTSEGLYAKNHDEKMETIATRKTVWSGDITDGTISNFTEDISKCDYLELTVNNGSTWQTLIFNFRQRNNQHVNITNQSDSNPNFANIESIVSVNSQSAPSSITFTHMRTIRISIGNEQEEGVFTDVRGEWLGETAPDGYRNNLRSIQGAWYNYGG